MKPANTTTRERVRSPRLAGLLLAAIAAGSMPLAAQSNAEDLRFTMGKSVVIDYPTDIARISTSNPEVVDAVAVSTREVLLHAKGHGASTIVIWAKSGQRTFYNVTVDHNLEPIRKILKETFPDENIQIVSAKDSVTLNGHVASQAVADKAAALAASLAKTVVNNLAVNPGPVEKQIVLRVKFAQVDRSASQSLGANLLSTGAFNTPGTVSTGQFSPARPSNVQGVIPGQLQGTATNFTLSDALNVFAFRPDLNLGATIRALQGRGELQVLAEPNLVTTNGKEASFLVGGEFPIPIAQGGSSAGSIGVQFKEFGIRLTFNPLMTVNKTMKLYVRPEVSAIDIANSVNVSGFRIPALSTRRMETNIELAPGQSFVVGGLIDDRSEQSFSRIPGLADIPVLGALFKSKSEQRSKSELIVLVTPEIVDPVNVGDPKPLPVFPLQWLTPAVPPSPRSTLPRSKTGGKVTGKDQKATGATVAAVPAGSVAPSRPAASSVVQPVARATPSSQAQVAGWDQPELAPADPTAEAKPATGPETKPEIKPEGKADIKQSDEKRTESKEASAGQVSEGVDRN
jgi:pilus assembly protein CpaC